MYDLIIIGAGVSGLMAAGVAASKGVSVLLLEKMEKPARKLRITGKGRCNITNTKTGDEFLAKVKSNAEFVSYALSQFDSRATVEFFNSIGVATVVERGDRIFSASGKAQDVALALEKWALKCGALIRSHAQVEQIEIVDNVVRSVQLQNGETIACRSVIITTGGVSYPATGSTGDGYQWAHDAGHDIVPLRPALTPLIPSCDITTLDGLQLRNVELKLMVDDVEVDSRFGDVDFYASNISGATILQISRRAVDAIIDGCKVDIVIDLKPALSIEKLINRIKREIGNLPDAPLKVLLQRLTPSPLHKFLSISTPLKTQLARLDNVEHIARALKALKFGIADYAPFTSAIITAGGVDTSQCDPTTMRSKLVDNLYFAGEVLDIDADTGGYNIQLALSTGHLAGSAASCEIGTR